MAVRTVKLRTEVFSAWAIKANTHEGFDPGACSGSFCKTSTHEGASCGSLLHITVHTMGQTKEYCFGTADLQQRRVWRLSWGLIQTRKIDYYAWRKRSVCHLLFNIAWWTFKVIWLLLLPKLSSLRLYFHGLYMIFYHITAGCLHTDLLQVVYWWHSFFEHLLADLSDADLSDLNFELKSRVPKE